MSRSHARGIWQVVHELPGRIRLQHPILRRRRAVCRAIERELMSVLGISNCQASPLTGTVLVHYSPRKLRRQQVIEILNSIPADTVAPQECDETDLNVPLCAASVPLAAVAQFAVPALWPISAGLLACTAIPSFKGAYQSVVKEKRLGGHVLDSIVVAGCLATGAIFAGSVACLCLGLGRRLSRTTQDNSQKMLLSAFGKLPRFARLSRDGAEIETPIGKLNSRDIIVVKTGDVMPIDGVVREGTALLNEHALTGNTKPTLKTIGDRVFASTLLISGEAFIEVESRGDETVSSVIARILNESASHRHSSQRRRELLADRAVLPTLALAGTALATVGPAGAMAIVYSDFRTGMRLAAPVAMLSSVALCAHRGIMIKEGRALESMHQVDTVLIDLSAMSRLATSGCDFSELGRVMAGLKERGIRHCAVVSSELDADSLLLDKSLEFDECFVGELPSDKVRCIGQLQQAGRKVCFVGDGIGDSLAAKTADASISLRGASSVAEDEAQIVFLNGGLDELCELRDIACSLDRNVNRSWGLIVVPNLLSIAGALTMGSGMMAALVTNSAASLAALFNGMLPLRRVAQERLERDLVEDLREMYHTPGEWKIHSSGIEAMGIETECVETATENDNLIPTGESEYGTIRNESVEVAGLAG